MTVVRRAAFAPFSPEQMFDLVNDVAAYPDFLPWCARSEVLAADEHSMSARLTVQRGRFDYSFTTHNRLVPGRLIELRLHEGPFRKLHGTWHFDTAEGGCLVRFHIDFEFRNRVLGAAMSAAFRPIADSLVDAFRERAHVVYGD